MSALDFFDVLYNEADGKLKEQCLQSYTEICSIIPETLFQSYCIPIRANLGSDAEDAGHLDVNFGAFEAHSELRALSTRTKKLIFIDVPRTFAEFNDKSSAVRSFLKNTERYSALLLVLSRILCSACKMFSAEYKQGMNFAAGAVLLNCAMKANDQAGAQQANKSASPVSAITACFSDMGAHDASYYISFDTEVKAYFAVCQLLSSDSLLPLLKSSGQLFAQVKRFEYVVSRCPETTRVVSHLESLGTNLDFLSNQWLSTCFSVGIPHNLTVSIQELILNKTGREIFLKMGLCIIVILQARILQLKEVKSIVDEIKLMVSQLNIDEVMYYFSHFRVNPDSTGILELIEPPNKSILPIILDETSVSEIELRDIRETFRLHTTAKWMRGNIDDEFREQAGSLYSSLIAANLPPPQLFFSGVAGHLSNTAKVTEWKDGQTNDTLSVWDVREMPAASVNGNVASPSGAENDFYEHSLLADILPRHKRGIYVDVPRTFSEFEQKSAVISKYLAISANKERMLCALCRMLCVACKLHRMGYCQGMNYIAGSVLLNCVCETEPEETGDELEIKACQLFCHLLTCQNIVDWFKESHILSKELQKLNFILMRHIPSSLAAQYLERSGFSTQVWAMEWFTTCCTVGAPRELALLVQNMLLAGKETDVIFKVGVAMISMSQNRILQLNDWNNLLQDLRSMLRNLDSTEVLRLTLRYRMNANFYQMLQQPNQIAPNMNYYTPSVAKGIDTSCVVS